MYDLITQDELVRRRAARSQRRGRELPIFEEAPVVIELCERKRTAGPGKGRDAILPASIAAVAALAELVPKEDHASVREIKSLRRQLDLMMTERDSARAKVVGLEAQLLEEDLPPLPPKSFWARFLDYWLGRSV